MNSGALQHRSPYMAYRAQTKINPDTIYR